jgi:DNA-binding NarL/FixJ family response regulator
MLVDDHPLVLESLMELLKPHFTIVSTVQHSGDIVSRAIEHRPDVILLDACMPGISGFAATKELKKLLPKVKIVLVTMLTEAISVSEAFRAGANGYVLKQSASDELRTAIDTVLAHKRFLSNTIEPQVREAVEHEWFRPEGYSGDLTGRQREVLGTSRNSLIFQGRLWNFTKPTLRTNWEFIRPPTLSSLLWPRGLPASDLA